MKIGLPFPKGHNKSLDLDKEIILSGMWDKSLKGKKAIFKGISEEDIREIRQMLIDEVKRQNDDEAPHEGLEEIRKHEECTDDAN